MKRKILGDLGGWEEEEIDDALDMRGDGVELDQSSAADDALKSLIRGKVPPLFWNATTMFQRKIMDFALSHRESLGDKFPKFIAYVRAHNKIVSENMRQLQQRETAQQGAQPQQGNPGSQNPEVQKLAQLVAKKPLARAKRRGMPQNAPTGASKPSMTPPTGSSPMAPTPTGQAGMPTPVAVNQQ